MLLFKARPAQNKILSYTGGLMGIKAVPGSGKTHTLSYLAAQLVRDDLLDTDQEILVVTLVNSAVENFSKRIATFIRAFGLLPNTGYRVRTLHGLAHDIIRERPDLAGLSDQFQIVDERESSAILNSIVTTWMNANPDLTRHYGVVDAENNTSGSYRDWEQVLISTASSFIRIAKDYQRTAAEIEEKIHRLGVNDLLLQFGLNIYKDYQQALHYRGAIDYDDLVWLALRALESDTDFLERLRRRWPYILEDEAQDSSRLQEKSLRLLAGPGGNWVRVGDPNQAIFETFTTAHPKYLLDFIERDDVTEEQLPDSGRSTKSIIGLANHLIKWSRSSAQPNPEMRSTLSTPIIHPTPPNDPQPNPPDQPDQIHLYEPRLTPDEELENVARSVANWLSKNPDRTAAILVARNDRGAKMVDALNDRHIQPVELLRSSASTRQTADILASILEHLSDPTTVRHLAKIYQKLKHIPQFSETDEKISQQVYRLIRNSSHPEKLLWPASEQEWFGEVGQRDESILTELGWFCDLIRRWHKAAILSIDQLILTLSLDLFTLPVDLALAHKLALSLEITSDNHPEWLLPNFANELQLIASNRRKFLGFANEDTGFDPDEHKGKVVVTTMHKAKGLEWDRVYILSANNYNFPYGLSGDQYIGEKWFVKNHLNLEEETLGRLKALLQEDQIGVFLEEGLATRQARTEYARERLRLFYVGITRAKSELVVTWNSGKSGNNTACVPLQELVKYWNEKNVPPR